MSRIQRKWTLAIAVAILGMALAALAAQAVMLQPEAASPGLAGSGIDSAPVQQGDFRVAVSEQQEKKSRRLPTKGAQGSGFDTQKGSKGAQGTGFDKGGTAAPIGGAQGTGYDKGGTAAPIGGGGTGAPITGAPPHTSTGAPPHTSTGAPSGSKTFIIDHPTDTRRYLVHATLEGPEGAVFYRGTARLKHGRAEVVLPSYFESLTHSSDRTVILTNIDGFDRLAVEKQRDGKVANGRFIVISDNPNSAQEFDWEVKAVRKDVPRLVDTPLKNDISVAGFGPYTFIDKR